MKAVLLAGSLVANAALLFAAVHRSTGFDFFSRSHSAPAAAGASSASAVANPTAAPHFDPGTWDTLATPELAATAARLKAEGFPVSLQRAILSALVVEHFADRHKALADLIDAQPWWRGSIYGTASGAKILAQRQQLQRDETDAIDQLLGVGTGASAYARASQARRFGNLPPEKATALSRIESDYNELSSEIQSGAQNMLLAEDREKLAFLEQEKRADIAKLLSPDELLEYDLRNSSTATQLRYQLSAFNPTEDEFRAIFKVQQAFDAQYAGGNYQLMTLDQRRQWSEARTQVAKQIEAVLPPDRAAEYALKTDSSYLQTNALVSRLELPATATNDIVGIQKDITKRVDAMRTDRSLTAEQRTAQLTALGLEADARLMPILGEAGMKAYKQNAGYWLNNLRPPPPPPARP
ncbi:MAG TPA: hypothetical protein VHD62_16340 [Opitutaceae bacterium]|nr:hypothetical protein [Opitutaceae bacterium]